MREKTGLIQVWGTKSLEKLGTVSDFWFPGYIAKKMRGLFLKNCGDRNKTKNRKLYSEEVVYFIFHSRNQVILSVQSQINLSGKNCRVTSSSLGVAKSLFNLHEHPWSPTAIFEGTSRIKVAIGGCYSQLYDESYPDSLAVLAKWKLNLPRKFLLLLARLSSYQLKIIICGLESRFYFLFWCYAFKRHGEA